MTAILIEFGWNADGLLTTSRPVSNMLATHRPRICAGNPTMQLPAPLLHVSPPQRPICIVLWGPVAIAVLTV